VGHIPIACGPTLAAQHQLTDSAWREDPRMRYVARSAKTVAKQMVPPMSATEIANMKRVDAGLHTVVGRMHRAGVVLLTGTDTSVLAPPGFILHDELARLAGAGLLARSAAGSRCRHHPSKGGEPPLIALLCRDVGREPFAHGELFSVRTLHTRDFKASVHDRDIGLKESNRRDRGFQRCTLEDARELLGQNLFDSRAPLAPLSR
jgi:hypothetical protein